MPRVVYLLVFSCIFVFFLGLQRENTKKGGINEEKKYLFLSDIFKKLTELLFKKSSFLVSNIERNVPKAKIKPSLQLSHDKF